ncbi:hypothetical protein PAP_00125 [Palaeococcus pacificus DY20341]|uniref:Flavodoxin-like domain-containing protein n=1 Tax=Palaeococcus pacificus DY20341 TaxID=1343739 RepID=A0A075LR65_9EURY|nr:NAD(P)H-dependent oxidoreductase [Palaeococcus pacificus]AIF68472.1 hypothetical protein PAP_00125 [Palaeococcus pacificus DY20341]
MAKILVVFYSRSGNTKKVAQALAKALNADLEEIIDTKNRKGPFGFLRSGLDAMFKRLTKINEIEKDPSEYGLVIIGTPVWVGTISAPIRTYLHLYSDKLKDVAFFCTCDDSNGNSFKHMEELCKEKPIATLEVKEKEVENREFTKKVEDFVRKIQKAS